MKNQKEQNKKYAEETLNILKTGKIRGLDISKEIKLMQDSTKAYIKEYNELSNKTGETNQDCNISLSTCDTLESIRRQLHFFGSSCALNFASAKHPGGGFVNGARAQEESLCYSSLLSGSLETQKQVYEYSLNHLNNGLYSTWAIYSPNVILYRNKDMEIVEGLLRCSFITSPSPNQSVFKGKPQELRNTRYERCKYILDVAIENQEKNLVLGAFGCGVFKNSPMEVATCWYKLLFEEGYSKYFDNIEFAILGNEKDENYKAFRCIFSRKLKN